jgi:hypothetical protein
MINIPARIDKAKESAWPNDRALADCLKHGRREATYLIRSLSADPVSRLFGRRDLDLPRASCAKGNHVFRRIFEFF